MQLIVSISLKDQRCKRRFLCISTFLFVLVIELLFFWKSESMVLAVFNGPILYVFSLLFIYDKTISSEQLAIHLIAPFLYLCLLNSVFNQYIWYTVGVPSISLIVYGCAIVLNKGKYRTDLHISVWVKYLGWLSIILGILSFVSYLRREEIMNVQFCVFQYIIAILMFTLIYTMLLIFNLIVYNSKQTSTNLPNNYGDGEHITLTDASKKHWELICVYFDNSTNYLNPDFALEDFALGMGMEKKAITAILNKELNISFYNLLALKRVEIAKSFIKSQSELYTLEYIMIESGFRSRSTFNRNFKRIVGVTPSEYREGCFKIDSDV